MVGSRAYRIFSAIALGQILLSGQLAPSIAHAEVAQQDELRRQTQTIIERLQKLLQNPDQNSDSGDDDGQDTSADLPGGQRPNGQAQPAPRFRPQPGPPRSFSFDDLTPGPPKKPDAQPQTASPKKKPERRAPVSVASQPAQRQSFLDALFKRLHEAKDSEEARAIAEAIIQVWLRSGSDTADLLLDRAIYAFLQKDVATARALFDQIIELQPDWAEAFVKRGEWSMMAGETDAAIADMQRALALEPRHFGALTTLGALMLKKDNKTSALNYLRRALALYPEQPDLTANVEKLRIEVEGRDI